MEILYGCFKIWQHVGPSQSLQEERVCQRDSVTVFADICCSLRVPEAFIWQAFLEFARVAVHMSNIRFPESVAPVGENPFILHLDLKHDNGKLSLPTKLDWLMLVQFYSGNPFKRRGSSLP